ncbi:hypothetical protein [Streptomyces sp. 142MFCol3.1]|uniref:hypothetical protein n=1 Tax=Streptomyces sp. 142MFCol3.1 TaxID=1172179 RepID=UPI00131A185E|nr:hypothetical protein [Streptomyces sp. 142MFCol3.1]
MSVRPDGLPVDRSWLGRPIDARPLFGPALAALPYTLRDSTAPVGTQVRVIAEGPAASGR